jgi:hypothetical protein
MKVEITRGVMINGEPVKAGSFIEVDQQTANILFSSDKAKVAVEKQVAPVTETPLSCPPKPPSKRGRSKNSFGEEK